MLASIKERSILFVSGNKVLKYRNNPRNMVAVKHKLRHLSNPNIGVPDSLEADAVFMNCQQCTTTAGLIGGLQITNTII